MNKKLQALIEDQKVLTARFEELVKELQSTTKKTSILDPSKVYIKGHPTRGAEVIKMLEDLGGVNKFSRCARNEKEIYYIANGIIVSDGSAHTRDKILRGYTEGHLPEYVSEVDPPKEDIELIEGEVYSCGDLDSPNSFIFVFDEKDEEDGIFSKFQIRIYDSALTPYREWLTSVGRIKIATPDQRKQLFNALEKAGKHFDKENMRLLDIEEWSCEIGEAFIGKHQKESIWEAKIYTGCIFGDTLGAENGGRYIPIPYKDQTKHLISTTNNPDKHYKFNQPKQETKPNNGGWSWQ